MAEDSYETLAARHLEKSAVVSHGPDSQKVEALRGIGYALLAINAGLTDGNALASDLTDEVHAVADQVGDLAVPADRLADAAEALAGDMVAPLTAAATGPGKSAVMVRHLRGFLRRHPGAEVRVVDLKAGDVPPWDAPDAVTLSAADAVTVRRALADAAAVREARSGLAWAAGSDWYLPVERGGDSVLAGEYAAVLARLGGVPGGDGNA